ncbi:MAG: PEP-CTERM sorting domain-containing protein [Opitutales bacterium]|nr:PEP-CTERM sorting domain-containing protein [Opitutales bacterium]
MIKLLFTTGALLLGGVLFANAQKTGSYTNTLRYDADRVSGALDALVGKDHGSYRNPITPSGDRSYLGFVTTQDMGSAWTFDSVKWTVTFKTYNSYTPDSNTDVYFGIRYVDGTGKVVDGTADITSGTNFKWNADDSVTFVYNFSEDQTWTVGESKLYLVFDLPHNNTGADINTELQYQGGAPMIPEPSAFGLLAGLGALALVASRRKRRFAK